MEPDEDDLMGGSYLVMQQSGHRTTIDLLSYTTVENKSNNKTYLQSISTLHYNKTYWSIETHHNHEVSVHSLFKYEVKFSPILKNLIHIQAAIKFSQSSLPYMD